MKESADTSMDTSDVDVSDVDDTSIDMEAGMPEDVPEDVPENVPVDVPKDVSEAMLEEVPEDVLEEEEPDWERTSLTPLEEITLLEMEENGEIEIPEVSEDMTDPEQSKLHLPDASGEFLGNPGNSAFRPDNESALQKMGEYGRDTVEYKDEYPDFSPFTKHNSLWGELDSQVEIGHMTDNRKNPTWEFGRRPPGTSHDPDYDLGNFAQADNSLLERIRETNPDVTVDDVVAFREHNNLTWHECADGKTMQLVPTEIHDACRHSGGVSEMKYRMAWGDIELPY